MLHLSTHICPQCGEKAIGYNGGFVYNARTEAVCTKCGHKFVVTLTSDVCGLLKRWFQ